VNTLQMLQVDTILFSTLLANALPVGHKDRQEAFLTARAVERSLKGSSPPELIDVRVQNISTRSKLDSTLDNLDTLQSTLPRVDRLRELVTRLKGATVTLSLKEETVVKHAVALIGSHSMVPRTLLQRGLVKTEEAWRRVSEKQREKDTEVTHRNHLPTWAK